MKMLKLLVSTALVATTTPALVSPAYATIIPSQTTVTMETNQCAADLAPYAGVLLHDETPSFSTEVVETGQVDGSPIEVVGSRIETPGSRFGTGSITYSNVKIVGDPFRTGGSVNMFGDQVATNKNWSNSEYDFTAEFDTKTTISYTCEVTQQTETYHPAVHIPGHGVIGHYVLDQVQSPNAADQCSNKDDDFTNTNYGQHWGNCDFILKQPAVDPIDTDEFWTLDAPIDRTALDTFHTADETNAASGTGHEVNGGPFTEVGTWLASKVVVCISPKRLPGIWTQQNGYTGTKCTTAWFGAAPWGGGSQTSNGTYISVPGV